MTADNDTMRFNFSHTSPDGDWSFDNYYEYGTPWDKVLTDFINFLSAAYGYDIRRYVEIKDFDVRLKEWTETQKKKDECGDDKDYW